MVGIVLGLVFVAAGVRWYFARHEVAAAQARRHERSILRRLAKRILGEGTPYPPKMGGDTAIYHTIVAASFVAMGVSFAIAGMISELR